MLKSVAMGNLEWGEARRGMVWDGLKQRVLGFTGI